MISRIPSDPPNTNGKNCINSARANTRLNTRLTEDQSQHVMTKIRSQSQKKHKFGMTALEKATR